MILSCEVKVCTEMATTEHKSLGFLFRFCNKHNVEATFLSLKFNREIDELRYEYLKLFLQSENQSPRGGSKNEQTETV